MLAVRRVDEKRKRLAADPMCLADCTVRRVSTAEADDVSSLVEEYYDVVSVVARDDRATILDYLVDPESGVWLAYCEPLLLAVSSIAVCLTWLPLVRSGACMFDRRFVVAVWHKNFWRTWSGSP